MPKDTSKLSESDKVAASMTLRVSGSRQLLASTRVATANLKVKAQVRTTSSSPSPLPTPAAIDVEQRLASLERDTMEESWFQALKPEFEKPYFRKLKSFLLEEHHSHTVYPPLNDVYSWSRLTPLDQVKVVILGQDPYHNVGQAHGLSFSVLPPTKLPGSLKNIYKQLSLDYPEFIPPSEGDLTALARLGVLWLNTSLTVRAHKAASHANKGWETFTAQVIRAVMNRNEEVNQGIVFMAWGAFAQKTCAGIGINEKKHLVLKSAHPSPLSAHRGFIGNGHFRLANAWLKERCGDEAQINWMVLSRQG
ncbi:hypothetical protein H2248_009584 [Termitomyces sp. 'cryptogamus']|nr:hypothetical protein H2248_009584 [Termitomyces sp. 'cryptogamus']